MESNSVMMQLVYDAGFHMLLQYSSAEVDVFLKT